MFPRSVQLVNFLYYSVGALKQFCLKTFFAIDELWILQIIKSFQLPLKWCFEDPSGLIIFFITLCVWRSNLADSNWIQSMNFELKKNKNKRFQPPFRGCSRGRCSLLIFYIPWVHWSNSAETFFLQSTNFEFYKKLKAFNSPLSDVSKIQVGW